MQRFTALTAIAVAGMVAGCGDQNAQNAQIDNGVAGPVSEAPAVPLVNASGEIIGEVRGGDSDQGATLLIEARGLPPGTHGLHIHEVGLCEPPGFTSAGPHWNPTGAQHGGENPQGAHLGDLENVTVGQDGTLRAEIRVPGTYLRTAGRNQGARQILDNSGAALVLHAKADDYRTDPSGDSGERIACAVLGSPPPGSVVGEPAAGSATNTAGGNAAATNASATNAAATNASSTNAAEGNTTGNSY